MRNDLCELRFDVPLPEGADARGFERGWLNVLAAQKLTAIAAPPAVAVFARFRLCGAAFDHERISAWTHYLTARLAALPGAPTVAADPAGASPDWSGVKIWLSYPARDLTPLLQKSKKKARLSHTRGRRS